MRWWRSSLIVMLARHLIPTVVSWRWAIIHVTIVSTPVIYSSIITLTRRLDSWTTTVVAVIPSRFVPSKFTLVD
jgi:hypothetical protein